LPAIRLGPARFTEQDHRSRLARSPSTRTAWAPCRRSCDTDVPALFGGCPASLRATLRSGSWESRGCWLPC